MNTLDDIAKEYNVNFIVVHKEYKAYETEIVSIFNSGNIKEGITEPCVLYCTGLYYSIHHMYELAVKYYLMAIELGNIGAMHDLACYYQTVENNYELAVKYYLMAADRGHNGAINNLAYYYQTVENNHELAVKYYLIAADRGHNGAINNLAYYYQTVENNYELAVKYYLMGADKGNSAAMNNLAYYYYKIEKNYELAIKYCLKAINAGFYKHISYWLSAICDIKILNSELQALFIECYHKVPGKFDSVIKTLEHSTTIHIYNLIGKECQCQACTLEYKKTHLAKMDTCEICMGDAETVCIPYNMPDVCRHFTCVDCHIKLSALKSNCPFCRL